MKLKQLFTDDSAVSPVIGVILMVAITVILAAVIGTFVLNLGGSVSQTTPQASFSWDQNSDSENVTVTHEGGATFEELSIVYTQPGETTTTNQTWEGPISAASSTTTDNAVKSGTDVRLVYTADDGSTATVGQFTVG